MATRKENIDIEYNEPQQETAPKSIELAHNFHLRRTGL